MRQGAIKATASATPTAAPAAKRRPSLRQRSIAIPPLLLEEDVPPAQKVSPTGPGERYALGPTPPGEHLPHVSGLRELPESYGTRRLFLTARDPHWLYASWDLTREQRQEYNSLSLDGHLIVRTYINSVAGEPLVETHVHRESRSWFIHVGRGGTRYVAELGYRGREGHWQAIATSTATMTPPDRLSEDLSVQFATLPAEVKFEEVVEVLRKLVSEHVPLIEAIQQLRAAGYTALPEISVATPPAEAKWTPAQTEALAKVLTMDSSRRVWMGSLEITELIRRQLQEEISSMAAAELARRGAEAPGEAVTSVSSPFGGAEKRRGFWFNVNAELIIYGATEPAAKLHIGGRQVKLRSDGTFSFRFALPDGEFELPVTATAPDDEEARQAKLSFRRVTCYEGEVGAHPQDKSLQVPSPANVA